MNDHASKQFLAKKKSIAGRFSAFCEAVCKLPPVSMVNRYRGYRRANFTRHASFWLAINNQ